MSSFQDQESETALLTGTGDLSNDYELRQILSVASAYLDAGQVTDAEDLLQDAMEADPHHEGVQSLLRRLLHVRGVSDDDVNFIDDGYAEEQPDVLLHFTTPLPDASRQTPSVQRLVRAGEQYFKNEKIYSALDLTHVLCAEAPEFLPGFVRLAEIEIAMGNVERARDIFSNLVRRYDLEDEPAPALMQSLGIALNPGDTSALIGYAMSLLDAGDISMLHPFVPEAIQRAVGLNASAARDLADAYIALLPDDESAQRLYLQVIALSNDSDTFVETARKMINERAPLDLLILRMSAEIVSNDGEWLRWAEHVTTRLRSNPSLGNEAFLHLQNTSLRESLPQVLLAKILMLNACERWNKSSELAESFDIVTLNTPVEEFGALYAQAIALDKSGDSRASRAYMQAAQTAYTSEVEAFARETTLFGTSAAPEDILRKAATDATGHASIDTLTGLRDKNPERLDIRTALADAHLEAGNVFESLKELRYIAETHERAGNMAGMLNAMQRISSAVPNNIEMKAKLIEGYLRRGVLDEAVDELERIGTLYEARNRIEDAVSAYTKAAEVTVALGEFKRGNALFDCAVRANPNDLPVRHAAVAFYLQTGSIASATEQLREVVRIALNRDERDEAVATLHQIIALAPQDPDAYHKLGEVLTSMGEYTQAERVYRRLASFTPDDPVLEAKQSALAVLAATH